MNIRTKRAELCRASKRLSTLTFSDKSSFKAVQRDKDRSYNTHLQHKEVYNKWDFYNNLIKAMEKKEEII